MKARQNVSLVIPGSINLRGTGQARMESGVEGWRGVRMEMRRGGKGRKGREGKVSVGRGV